MAELVSVAEFDNVHDAYVIKSRLESEGIPCYLSNENLNSIFGANHGFAQVKIMVNLNDSFKAMDILYEEDSEENHT